MCAMLGGPLHAATLTGYFAFDNSANLGQATVGNNLTIVGTAPTYSATLTDDFSTSLSGVITTTSGTANRLVATHGIAPNPTYAINYTFVMDIFSPAASRNQWRSIFQTNQSNINDADYFISNNNNLGVSGIGYSTGTINEGKWTRVAITVYLNLDGGDVKTSMVVYSTSTRPMRQRPALMPWIPPSSSSPTMTMKTLPSTSERS